MKGPAGQELPLLEFLSFPAQRVHPWGLLGRAPLPAGGQMSDSAKGGWGQQPASSQATHRSAVGVLEAHCPVAWPRWARVRAGRARSRAVLPRAGDCLSGKPPPHTVTRDL